MNKTILITGASSGIGKETAKYFQEKGWNVVATMRTPEKEEELSKLENILITRLDVTDSASIKSAVAEGIEKFGKIDALLNNAGYGAYGLLEAFSMDNIRRQFDVNVIGLIETTKAVIPHFRENKDGVIVNISSVGGKVAMPLGSLYHGSKFAVEGISESLHFEMEKIGVKVKIVEPGAIKTDFAGRSFDFANDESIGEYQELVKSLLSNFEALTEHASEASLVAETIYSAVTDGSKTLRYIAGEDAKQYIETRKKLDDEEFIKQLKQQLSI